MFLFCLQTSLSSYDATKGGGAIPPQESTTLPSNARIALFEINAIDLAGIDLGTH